MDIRSSGDILPDADHFYEGDDLYGDTDIRSSGVQGDGKT